jgi:hypothetical protein
MREVHNVLNCILLKSHSSWEAFLIHYNVVIYDDSKKTETVKLSVYLNTRILRDFMTYSSSHYFYRSSSSQFDNISSLGSQILHALQVEHSFCPSCKFYNFICVHILAS